MESDFEGRFKAIFAIMDDVGRKYAEAKSVSWGLQEQKKCLLADLMKSAEGSSMAEKERNALASDAYRLHLEGTQEAIHEELRLKAIYDNSYARYEALRSLCSLEKKLS